MSDSVTMEKSFAIDLVDSKFKFLKEEMRRITDKWNYTYPQALLNDPKIRNLKEAEDDAVSLKYVLKFIDDLYEVKNAWS